MKKCVHGVSRVICWRCVEDKAKEIGSIPKEEDKVMALRAKDPNAPKGEIETVMNKEGWNASRWWRAIGPDGALLAETSNPAEFDHMEFPVGTTVQHMYMRTEESWITENPK